jgi:RNA polymerase sigma-70 factor (ECF subfamily)
MSSSSKALPAGMAVITAVDWSAAYQELLPRVFHYFCLRTGDAAEAEDLTSATFERAWKGRMRFRQDRGGFERWLFGIARHVAITHFRRRRRAESAVDLPEHSTWRPIEEAATRRQQFHRLAALLDRLPAREREIFALKYGAQFTNRAIASTLHLSESNVGTIVHRVLSQLRDQLQEEP